MKTKHLRTKLTVKKATYNFINLKNLEAMKIFISKPVLIFSVLLLSFNTYAQFGGGSGTEDDPYQIYTREDFEEFASVFNSENVQFGDFTNIHIRLMNDITDTITVALTAIAFNGYFHGGGP